MQNTNSNYRNFSLDELKQLLQSKVPTPVNMVLDSLAVEFLLSLNTNNRDVNFVRVKELCRDISTTGWKTSESMCVTREFQLGNGQHRLLALQKIGFPPNAYATVVFGIDKATVLTIDQHQKRTASAALKINTGKSHNGTELAMVRLNMICNTTPGTMGFEGNRFVSPANLLKQLMVHEELLAHLPLLFSSKGSTGSSVKLTAPMALAVFHYAQRAGINHANDFLEGVVGKKPVLTGSAEGKAREFRLSVNRKNSPNNSVQYRKFVTLCLAHFERRPSPRVSEAMSWGKLSTQKELETNGGK